MKLSEFKQALAGRPESIVRFRLPNGELIPIHAHVTEAARIDKRFVDCGGTFRQESLCRLQMWVADDREHRLTARKLARILDVANALFEPDDLDIDIEHEAGWVSQFPVASVALEEGALVFSLSERHTACLALDQCCPPAATPRISDFRPLHFTLKKP